MNFDINKNIFLFRFDEESRITSKYLIMFMYLYKGIVGIRDKKAHLNFVQNDPIKTLEFLSFASLLLRLLDENIK